MTRREVPQCMGEAMAQTIEIPIQFLEEMANFQFPGSTQERLDCLMDKNNEGLLEEDERQELWALVDINERVSLLKGKALLLLCQHGN